MKSDFILNRDEFSVFGEITLLSLLIKWLVFLAGDLFLDSSLIGFGFDLWIVITSSSLSGGDLYVVLLDIDLNA